MVVVSSFFFTTFVTDYGLGLSMAILTKNRIYYD